jgi:hypothetical protein
MPQAWAASSTFLMLQSALGLSVDASAGEVRLTRPRLPLGVDHLEIIDLRIGDTAVEIDIRRVGGEVDVVLGDRSDRSISVVVEDEV